MCFIFQPNEAGEKFLALLQDEWHTEELFQPQSDSDEFTVRAFHGEYKLVVRNAGTIVKEQNFSVDKGQENVVDVDI